MCKLFNTVAKVPYAKRDVDLWTGQVSGFDLLSWKDLFGDGLCCGEQQLHQSVSFGPGLDIRVEGALFFHHPVDQGEWDFLVLFVGFFDLIPKRFGIREIPVFVGGGFEWECACQFASVTEDMIRSVVDFSDVKVERQQGRTFVTKESTATASLLKGFVVRGGREDLAIA